VDNATVHVPAKNSVPLPYGRLIENGDTLAVYTARGTCAGYGVWSKNGATLAAARADSMVQGARGFLEGEPLKLEVFDVSAGSAIDVDSSITYVSCSDRTLGLCRDDGQYVDGTIHRVAGVAIDSLPVNVSDFTVSTEGSVAIVEWRTANGASPVDFEVLHQPPGKTVFSTLTVAEEANQPDSYRTRAEGLSTGMHQFRLRQVEPDGTSHMAAVVRVNVEAKKELDLTSPAPHPVQSSTRLTFTVVQEGHATVGLYNVLGQRVRTLYDEKAKVGRLHDLRISAQNLASGTYFVYLQAPSGTRTQPMVVVR
jgi:uncharacterized protein YndB with AHSA1/START domain